MVARWILASLHKESPWDQQKTPTSVFLNIFFLFDENQDFLNTIQGKIFEFIEQCVMIDGIKNVLKVDQDYANIISSVHLKSDSICQVPESVHGECLNPHGLNVR